eukprot:TRINITY_DN29287_c0_g1_i8.p2 TRINITY_DN29287_c0_g1~~TRINITY_DN29287_c0_g1_i8.p2  ORF type:complete len:249 (-),score=52.53 TRINITY_DN29287_c0_g1_i8:990-1736(-)
MVAPKSISSDSLPIIPNLQNLSPQFSWQSPIQNSAIFVILSLIIFWFVNGRKVSRKIAALENRNRDLEFMLRQSETKLSRAQESLEIENKKLAQAKNTLKEIIDAKEVLERELKQMQSKSIYPACLKLKDIDSRRLLNEIKISGGAFKKVFKCELDGKPVAVAKFEDISLREQFRKQHLRELKTFAISSGHPNIVQLEGWTKEGWIVMEFCPKKLADVQSTLTFDGRLSLAVEISRGLTFLHRLKISH